MLLSEKTTKYKGKVRTKCAKTAISGIFPAFSAGKKIFSKIGLGHIMGIANTHLCAKNQKKLMKESRENVKKPSFPAYFRYFQPGKIFFRKSGSVTFWALPFCIFVPKINETISRKAGNRRTDKQTNRRTNGQRLIYRTSKVGPKSRNV